MVDFDVHHALERVHDEMTANRSAIETKLDQVFDGLGKKIDSVGTNVQDHETRIVVVEGTRRTMRWLAAAISVAFFGALADFFFVHLPQLMIAAASK